jgi:carbamoyltransferase
MQSHMNLKVKFRESFRPFAPMVLAEDAQQYFDIKQESPYMLLVYPVARNRRLATNADGKSGLELLKQLRSDIPAVTHVDYSARVQTVDRVRNPLLYGVLKRFRAATACSVIINTSFNVRGEPIVNTVEDACRCWMATEIDCLVLGNRWLERAKQQNRPLTDDERKNWLRRFELD